MPNSLDPDQACLLSSLISTQAVGKGNQQTTLVNKEIKQVRFSER